MSFTGILKATKVPISALVFVLAGAAQAQMPVTDSAHISTSIRNQVESLAKWAKQFDQLKQQIYQSQQQYEAITGSRGMGALLDNSALKTALPSDWKQVLSDIKNTKAYATERGKYPTLETFPKTNAMYDVIASQDVIMSDLYSKATRRLSLIQSLTAQIDSANDPAAKADLANRLISEQNAIQANQNLVTILQAKQKQELEVASQAAAEEFSCKEFKRSGC
ncbi:type IV secretion system protein (plasmid) [Xylella taiwanensis]|uniref:Type IV secretion system protein n=1 Tax=Xylella taiwanensis TaxID=1444770 RepID=A0ABS8TYR7_9GAMM|nr:type IV secretion system protein [Xylella taiwanensis]MCD8459782.1 type IV secretion system protein [Xylella taiwanensis]MCD8474171.1 type IV secretion system protein [Xylella taiwanensis]UFN08051.1 type IV secretion system protein [Xylella taiwanensis]UFN10344.1 type IV secretion system protein [Xylella taiwanensis]UFN12632.1 type IV secretion system protein [Xylella taiwanensis]